MFNFESQQYLIISMYHATQKYINAKQGKMESLTDYYKRFKLIVEVLEHYGADIWSHPSLFVKKYHKDWGTNMTIVLECWLIIPLFPVGILLGWGEGQMLICCVYLFIYFRLYKVPDGKL